MNINTEQGMKDAIAWTNNYLGKLATDGVWLIPRSGMRVIKKGHRDCEVYGGYADDSIVVKVLKASGWNVKEMQ